MLDFRVDPATLDHIDRARLTIDDQLARDIALALIWRTKQFLASGVYRDGSHVHVMRVFIEQTYRARQQMIAYVEAELLKVDRPSGFRDYYTLTWHPHDEEFILRSAPSE